MQIGDLTEDRFVFKLLPIVDSPTFSSEFPISQNWLQAEQKKKQKETLGTRRDQDEQKSIVSQSLPCGRSYYQARKLDTVESQIRVM